MAALLIVLALAVGAAADVGRDGRLVLGGETHLTGGSLEHVTIWDLASGRIVRVLNGEAVWDPVFSRDERLVVGGGKENTAVIFDSTSGRVVRALHGFGGYLMDAVFSPDGRLVAALDGEPAIMEGTYAGIWSTATGRRLHTFECGDYGHCESAEFSLNGRELLVSGTDRTARLWDVRSGRLIRTFGPGPTPDGLPATFADARFSRDGRLVVLEAENKNVKGGSGTWVYDAATAKTRFVLIGESDAGLSRDSMELATHTDVRTIRIHDARSGRLLKTLHDPRGAAGQLVFSNDSSRLLSYVDSHGVVPYRALRIWDIAHGTIEHTIRTTFDTTEYSPNGNLFVTIGPSLQVWDVDTGKLVHTLRR